MSQNNYLIQFNKILNDVLKISNDIAAVASRIERTIPPSLMKKFEYVRCDAEKVRAQIDVFLMFLLDGEEVFEDCPAIFLKEIWSGDVYGKGGIKGLELLYNSLKLNLKQMNVQSLSYVKLPQSFY